MRLILPAIVLVLVVLLVSMTLYTLKPSERIAFFNKEAVYGQLIRQLAERKATEAQVAQTTRRFHAVLSQTLAHYTKRHQVVILDQKLVLAGGLDVTTEVTAELSQAMRKAS
ncbi:F pilus extension/retraction protein TrbI Inner membrane protein [Legionella beliardensis]|uniref:F pilus extension/retraction protein TrbI Inner membrane protein n=1 Tax=Legionella beliardensis TaxID=91822 RepID=A0A378JR69_9GAMM|nr:TrbI F-type domain-containing protein [Legionella beliardensis]STX55691.1 F pilus extension/retraction protein TrbI Inner membrane protein [Legionella beliardensis]